MQTKFGTNWSILKFWCARTRASRCARKICWHFSLTFDLKLMYTKYGWFLMTRYRDMIMTWFLQNGAWMTSRWPNDLEKVDYTWNHRAWWLTEIRRKLTLSISNKRVHKKVYGRNFKNVSVCTIPIKLLEFKSSRGRLRWSVFKSYDRL